MKLDQTYKHADGIVALRAYSVRGIGIVDEFEVMLFIKNGGLVYGPPMMVKNHAIKDNNISVGATEWVVSHMNALVMDLV